MSIDGWRNRLAAAITQSGRSERDVSLSAHPPGKPNLGAGYVHSILKEGKDPTIGNLQAICDALGVSIFFVLGGYDITPEREEFLRALVEADPRDVEAVSHLLAAGRQHVKNPKPYVE